MKKKIIITAYILILLIWQSVIFAGCSILQNSTYTGTKPPVNAGKDKARTNIRIAVWSTGYEQGIEQFITKYNQTNKDNINIDILDVSQDKYSEIINMLMTSGEGPDVFGLNSELMYSYIYKNWLVDLSKYIDDKYLSRFPSWAVNYSKDIAYEGSFYTVPATEMTFRMIYNKDLFRMAGLDPEKPPKTLDELKEYAKRITDAGKGDRKYGFALPTNDEWVAFVQSMEMSNAYSGVYYYDFKDGKYDLTVYKPWFDTILEMKNEGSMFPGDSSLKNDSARAQFAEGNIGMMYASSGDPSMLSYQFPSKCDWGVALPPALDKSKGGMGAIPVYPSFCFAVNSATSNLDQAIKVWKFLSSDEFLGGLYKNGEEIPVIKSITNDPKYKPSLKNFNEFVPSEMDYPYPNTPKFINDWSRMNAYTQAISGNSPVFDILREETDRLNAKLQAAEDSRRIDMGNYRNPAFNPEKPIDTQSSAVTN